VPPGGVGVAVLPWRTFTPTLAYEPLPVGIGGHVRGVDGYVLANVGNLLLDALDHGGDAGVEQVLVLA
jgi:hypothetical protein